MPCIEYWQILQQCFRILVYLTADDGLASVSSLNDEIKGGLRTAERFGLVILYRKVEADRCVHPSKRDS